MGQVPTVVEAHGQDGGPGLEQGLVGGQIGVGPGVGLHVGVLGAEERGGPVAGQVLDLVDDAVAAVVAPARVALRVLVGQHRARRGQDGRRGEVLRGDQLEGGLLAVQLLPDEVGHLGVGGQRGLVAAHGVPSAGMGWTSSRSSVEVGQLGDAPVVPAVLFGRSEEGVAARRARRPFRWCAPRSRPRWRGCAARPASPSSRRAPPRRGRRAPCWPPWRCRCRSRRRRRRARPAPPVTGAADRGAVVGVVDGDGAVVGAEIGDVMPLRCEFAPQDLLQVEPGVIRTDGDAHEHRVYRRPGRPRGRTRYAPRAMALDPRTPVVVGVGQVLTPPDAGLAPDDRPEPVELMARALRAAAEDCDGAAAGGAAAAGHSLLARADSIRVVVPLGWHTVNPALQVAARLGLRRRGRAGAAHALGRRRQHPTGAHARRLPRHQPGRARRGARHRRRGHVRPRPRAGRDPHPARLGEQPADTPPPTMFGVDKPGATDLEMNRGVLLPMHAYPLFENALRAANGWSLSEHAARIGDAVVRLQRGRGRQPLRLDPPAPLGRGHRHAVAGQPDDLVPLPQALHGEPAGGPGRGLHRLLGRGGAVGRGARGALGLPPVRCRRQRPLVHLASAPSSTAPPPSAWPARPPWSWPASASTTSPSSTSTPASPSSCRWRRRSSGWPSTTRPGR